MKTKPHAEFWEMLRVVIRKLNLLEKDGKACYGVTIPQSCTLEALLAVGPCPVSLLSEEVGVAESTMTRILDLLVRDGMVERSPAPGDRRVVMVGLTSPGKELARKLSACSEEYFKAVFQKVPADRRDQVLEACRILRTAIEELPECCRPEAPRKARRMS